MADRDSTRLLAWPKLSRTDLLLFRLGGDGLGNLLFTWARCLVVSQANGWPMVWPTWPSFKPRNWRVNPHDKRLYSGLFQAPSGVISGSRKIFEILTRKWFPESEAAPALEHPRSLLVFRGRGGYFDDFRDEHALVRGALLAMTRPPHLAGMHATDLAPVALHVRRGDFTIRERTRDTRNMDNSALPIEWYVEALSAVRAACGTTIPADVYSDGTDAELRPLTSLPGVVRRNWGSSIADLLALSRARVLIASGSTFSMWASYLGQCTTIWHPGKLRYRVLLEHSQNEFEWAAGNAMPTWIAHGLAERDAGEGSR